jgi:hypothetical protein
MFPCDQSSAAVKSREFAGIGRAQLCFVVPIPMGASWHVIEFTSWLEPTTKRVMPGSRVRIPPVSPASRIPDQTLILAAVSRPTAMENVATIIADATWPSSMRLFCRRSKTNTSSCTVHVIPAHTAISRRARV